MPRMKCGNCQDVFDAKREDAKFCCARCRVAANRAGKSCEPSPVDSVTPKRETVTPETGRCEFCGESMSVGRQPKRFCSDKCRVYANRGKSPGAATGKPKRKPVTPRAAKRNKRQGVTGKAPKRNKEEAVTTPAPGDRRSAKGRGGSTVNYLKYNEIASYKWMTRIRFWLEKRAPVSIESCVSATWHYVPPHVIARNSKTPRQHVKGVVARLIKGGTILVSDGKVVWIKPSKDSGMSMYRRVYMYIVGRDGATEEAIVKGLPKVKPKTIQKYLSRLRKSGSVTNEDGIFRGTGTLGSGRTRPGPASSGQGEHHD